jgi:hypothetical protein
MSAPRLKSKHCNGSIGHIGRDWLLSAQGSFTTGFPSSHFRNALKTGREFKPSVSTLCATSGCEQSQQRSPYSITSSARASSTGGTVSPSALAVMRLVARSKLVGCSTGGRLASFRVRSYRHSQPRVERGQRYLLHMQRNLPPPEQNR